MMSTLAYLNTLTPSSRPDPLSLPTRSHIWLAMHRNSHWRWPLNLRCATPPQKTSCLYYAKPWVKNLACFLICWTNVSQRNGAKSERQFVFSLTRSFTILEGHTGPLAGTRPAFPDNSKDNLGQDSQAGQCDSRALVD